MNFFKDTFTINFVKLCLFFPIILLGSFTYAQKASLGIHGRANDSKDIPSKRTAYSTTVANPDGTFTGNVFSYPINYLKESSYYPIDLKITDNISGRHLNFPFVNATNSFKSFLPTEISDGLLSEFDNNEIIRDMLNPKMYVELNGIASDMTNMSQSSIEFANDKAIFNNVYESINLSIEIQNGRRKADYVILDGDFLEQFPQESEYLVFEETIQIPNDWVAKIEGNSVAFYGRQGVVKASYDQPLLSDDSQSGQNIFEDSDLIFFDILQVGNEVILNTKVKLSWLRSSERVFPIVVDPDLITTPSSSKIIWDQTAPVGKPLFQNINTYLQAPSGSTIDELELTITSTLGDMCISNRTPGQLSTGFKSYTTLALNSAQITPLIRGLANSTTNATPGVGGSGNPVTVITTDAFNGEDPNQGFQIRLFAIQPSPIGSYRIYGTYALTITFTPPDCSALGVSNILIPDPAGLTNVTFNDINNSSSGNTVATGVALDTTIVCRGATYTLSSRVNTAGNYPVLAKAWIDWNNNDSYEEATEAYVLGYATNVTDGASNAPQQVTVPIDAVVGMVKMRVVASDQSSPSSSTYPTACDDMTWGEIEDYAVEIISEPQITSASPLVDSSTCGKFTFPVVVDALTGTGDWSESSGVVGILNDFSSAPVNSYTAQTPVNEEFNITWTSNVNAGICDGAASPATIQLNQPITTSIASEIADDSIAAVDSWLWGGLQSQDHNTAENWYKRNSARWEISTSEIPGANDHVYVLSNTVAGLCVSNYHKIIAESDIKALTIGVGAKAYLSGVVGITGNIVNNGDLLGQSGSELSFVGSADQTLSGDGANVLYDMRIFNGANSVILTDDVQVTNELDMAGGNIVNDNYILTIGSGSFNSGSIVYNSGTVTGKLKRYFENTLGEKFFPIGTATYLRDALINFNIGTPGINQSLTIAYKTGTAQAGGGGALTNGVPLTVDGVTINNISSFGYWEIVPSNSDYTSSICNVNYTMTLHMNNILDIDDVSTSRSIKSSGSNVPGLNHVVWTGLPAVSSTGTSDNFTITSITNGFSFFGTGGGTAPLPVELLSFSGNCIDGAVALNWQTASEYNSAYFIVDRSIDGQNWDELVQIPSAGFSNDLIPYSFMDYPHNSMNYYRLTQVDIDGTVEVFETKIISTDCIGNADNSFYTYPSPSDNGQFEVFYSAEAEQDITLKIIGARGDLVMSQHLLASKGVNIFGVNQTMEPGVYFISVFNDLNNYQTVKHIVK